MNACVHRHRGRGYSGPYTLIRYWSRPIRQRIQLNGV